MKIKGANGWLCRHPSGSGLGYRGIPNSVAVGNSSGVFTDGAAPTVPAIDLTPFGVNLHTGDMFYVHMTYRCSENGYVS